MSKVNKVMMVSLTATGAAAISIFKMVTKYMLLQRLIILRRLIKESKQNLIQK